MKFTKLTRANCRKLLVGQTLTEGGIAYEKLANGGGRFAVNIMVDKQRIHRVLGLESEGVTREQCEQFIEQKRTEARQGRLNLPKGRKVSLRFGEAAEEYLKRLEQSAGRDLKKKLQYLSLHLKPYFGDKSLSQFSDWDLDRYKKHRLGEGAKSSTVNRELATISHLFNRAVEWKWLDHKPIRIRRLKEDANRIVYLTAEQVQRLLEAAEKDANPYIYPFIRIGLATGMRRMEILSIRLEHIDVRQRTIYIPQAKAGARTQPITSELTEYLQAFLTQTRPGQEWLFPADSTSGHTIAIEKPFRRVVAVAGLDPRIVVRHTLRHTAITHLVQAGVDLPTVQRISGHKTMQMVVRYSHQNGEHLQAALDKLEERYKGKAISDLANDTGARETEGVAISGARLHDSGFQRPPS